MTKKQQIFQRLTEQANEAIRFLDEQGLKLNVDYHYEGIYLQGSQNYRTDHAGSDVDSKFILIPTFRGMLERKKMVYDITTQAGEKVSIKPLGDYLDLFWKGNINNLEILTTDHYEASSFIEMLKAENFADTVAKLVEGTLWAASIGMMHQKRKSVEKGTETTKAFVERNGYDPKDAGHLIRINALLERLAVGMPFTEALDLSTHPNFQLYQALRQDGLNTKEPVLDRLDFYLRKSSELRESVRPTDDPEVAKLKEALYQRYVNYVIANQNN